MVDCGQNHQPFASYKLLIRLRLGKKHGNHKVFRDHTEIFYNKAVQLENKMPFLFMLV